MTDIDKLINNLKTRAWLAERIKANETSEIAVDGIRISTSNEDGIQITNIIEVANIINEPLGFAEIGNEEHPYMAYINVYDRQFWGYVSVDQFLQYNK